MILTSRRQHRVLADMCAALGRTDPRLVARSAVFTQLTGDEEMPHVERVRTGQLRQAVLALRRRGGRGEPHV